MEHLSLPHMDGQEDASNPPLTPRTERRKIHETVNLHSAMVARGNEDPSLHNKVVYCVLGCCPYFIEHDCVSCPNCKPSCCKPVKLHRLKDSIDKVRCCAECIAGVGTTTLCLATGGATGCYECHVKRKKNATVVPLQEEDQLPPHHASRTTGRSHVETNRRQSPRTMHHRNPTGSFATVTPRNN